MIFDRSHHRRFRFALVLGAACAITAAGGLLASNMGFRYNHKLYPAGPNSLTGNNLIGLPYFPLGGVTKASDLFCDIGIRAQNIQKYLPATNSFQVYSYGAPDFPLVPGQGVFVKVGSEVDFECVGTHDPQLAITLSAAGPGSLQGANFYAPPYHSTSATAGELFAELGAGNVANIQGFLPKTNTFQLYSYGRPDFPLLPCRAYIVKMAYTVTFIPSHY